MLYAFVGTGAVLGVLLMPGLHPRYKIDPVVNVCTGLFACGLVLLAYVHTLWVAALILIFLGRTGSSFPPTSIRRRRNPCRCG